MKESRLPKVLSRKQIAKILASVSKIKHRCLLQLAHSAGLRIGELINLKITDIDSDNMLIRIEQAKGRKDRATFLSETLLLDLRKYYKKYQAKYCLFEGQKRGKYTSFSVQKVLKRASTKAGIR